MKAVERRKQIALFLLSQSDPVSGNVLSESFGVSRQIIVQDINTLKASGYDILSTHYGYIIRKAPFAERVFKLWHTKEQTADELSCIVEFGGTVVDVFVWHKVYGKISAPLNIFSKLQIEHFLEGVRTGKSTELMDITGGFHYHTVRADSEELLDKIFKALSEKNYIAPEV